MRRYQGFMADSARWERFRLRDDDVIITTPSKCGTTWMQTIVGMLLRDSVDLPPIGTISPWLDMQIRTEEEIFGLLDAQTGRRFIKTHTPLDGLPVQPVCHVSRGHSASARRCPVRPRPRRQHAQRAGGRAA